MTGYVSGVLLPKSASFFLPLVSHSHFASTLLQRARSCKGFVTAIMGLESASLQERLERWAQKLQNLTVSPLTRDYPEIQSTALPKRTIEAFEYLKLPNDSQLALRELSGSSNSGFTVFLAAFVVLVARLTGDEDIAVGTTSSDDGRPFVLRVPIDSSETFHQLFKKVDKVCVCFTVLPRWF